MSKVISDHTKNVTLYINLPPFLAHHEIIIEYNFVLEVLSFRMLSTWVKHQIVDIQYTQNSQCVQNYIFPNGKHIFPLSLINS